MSLDCLEIMRTYFILFSPPINILIKKLLCWIAQFYSGYNWKWRDATHAKVNSIRDVCYRNNQWKLYNVTINRRARASVVVYSPCISLRMRCKWHKRKIYIHSFVGFILFSKIKDIYCVSFPFLQSRYVKRTKGKKNVICTPTCAI